MITISLFSILFFFTGVWLRRRYVLQSARRPLIASESSPLVASPHFSDEEMNGWIAEFDDWRANYNQIMAEHRREQRQIRAQKRSQRAAAAAKKGSSRGASTKHVRTNHSAASLPKPHSTETRISRADQPVAGGSEPCPLQSPRPKAPAFNSAASPTPRFAPSPPSGLSAENPKLQPIDSVKLRVAVSVLLGIGLGIVAFRKAASWIAPAIQLVRASYLLLAKFTVRRAA